MSKCTEDLRKAGKAYPRTCAECGLGPCKWYPPPSMFSSRENSVYYASELVLTVHQVKNSAKTPAQQADAFARMLNSDASLRYRVFGG
jgi:hypothetical protein